MNEELNKKLAEWAGFTEQNTDKPNRSMLTSDIGYWWRTPLGESCPLPRFTSSLDACFKRLVPKLAENGFVVTVGSFEHSGYYAYANYMFNREPEETRADNPALALCLVIEKLIDAEEAL